MHIPFDHILDIIRTGGPPQAAFDALCDLGRTTAPSPLWNKLRTPNIDADILLAAAWLTKNLADQKPTGVYLGLDTLNENNGLGSNIEIGTTHAANPQLLDMHWAYSLEHYGENHLIEGIYKLHRAYRNAGSAKLPDYLFFFGYSGVVLTAALERIAPRFDCLYIWGFHDGDLAYLARSSPTTITRLATFAETHS
jgi:hypothetical protein